MLSNSTATVVSAMRRITATAAPQAEPMRRSRRGRERTAIAITSALSPASSRSIRMIASPPSRNCVILLRRRERAAYPCPRPAEVPLSRVRVFEDLRLQCFRAFELALLSHAPKKFYTDAVRRLAFERIEQKGLDGKVATCAERRAVPNVRDRVPFAGTIEVARSR